MWVISSSFSISSRPFDPCPRYRGGSSSEILCTTPFGLRVARLTRWGAISRLEAFDRATTTTAKHFRQKFHKLFTLAQRVDL